MFKRFFLTLSILALVVAVVPAYADDGPVMLGLGRVTALALSPDGAQLAIGTTIGVYFYDARILAPTNFWQTNFAVYQLAWSPRNDALALNGYHRMEVRALSGGSLLWSLDDACGLIKSISFSPDSSLAVARCRALEVFDATNGALIQSAKGRYDVAAFSADGRLAACCRRGIVEIWDVQNWQVKSTLDDADNLLAWSLDGQLLAVGSGIWNVSKNDTIGWAYPGDLLTSVAISPDGKWVAAGGGTIGIIRVWEVGKWIEPTYTLRGHPHWAGSLAWSPDSQTLYSAGNGAVRAWDIAAGQQRVIDGFAAPVYRVVWSGDGRYVVSQQGAHLAVTDVAARQPISAVLLEFEPSHCLEYPDGVQFPGHYDWYPCYLADKRGYSKTTDFVVSPTGNVVAMIEPGYGHWESGNWNWDPLTISLRRIESIEIAQRLSPGFDPVVALAFSPDGNYVAAGGGYSRILVWDAATATLQHNLLSSATTTSPVIALAFSGDAQTLYSLTGKGVLEQWNLATDQATQVQTTPAYYSTYGGRWLGAAALNLTVQRLAVHTDVGITVSDMSTGQALYTLSTSGVQALAVNIQGTRLAAVVGDKVIIWNLATGEQLVEHRGHTDRINNIAFSPEGSSLASGSSDGTVLIWPVP